MFTKPLIIRKFSKPSLFRAFSTGMGGQALPNSEMPLWSTENRSSLSFTMDEKSGALHRALGIFSRHRINVTQIKSIPNKFIINDQPKVDYRLDLDGKLSDPAVQRAISELRTFASDVKEVGQIEVPWFPTSIDDFNHVGKHILGEGDGIQEADHPSFRDPVYRQRRDFISKVALDYQMSDPHIPTVDYTKDEIGVWNYCYPKLKKLLVKNACDETNEIMAEMEKNVEGFSAETIPQLDAISKYLEGKTGWRLKPVGGLISSRDFLNGLAFKVFHSTQYVRHHSTPEYTPEPDIVHELVGHAPMFANKDFADFSQEIGLASLGASELELKRLGAIYWFTIEFGMCLDKKNNLKAYGAGIMSSFGELEYCVTDKPEFRPFDPYVIAQDHLVYPISEMQPIYFVAESFEKAKEQISNYCENINKPFHVSYNTRTNTIEVDGNIQTRPEVTDVDGTLSY